MYSQSSKSNIQKIKTILVAVTIASTLSGCMNAATLTGEPSYVGRDPSGRSVYQAPLWEGGGYFVYDDGARTFLRDR
jgi:hypothetical protein